MEGDIFEFLFELIPNLFELFFWVLEVFSDISPNPNNANTTSLQMPFSFVEVSFFVFQLLSMGYIGAFVLWYADGGRKAFSGYLIFKKYGFQPYLYGWTSSAVLALFICFMVKLSIQF
jgi:hypothetical protein